MRRKEGNCVRTKKVSDTVQCDPPRGESVNCRCPHLSTCEVWAFSSIMLKGNKIKYIYFKWS